MIEQLWSRHEPDEWVLLPVAAHFVGSIVYVEKGLYRLHVSSHPLLLVIDGQQRLTTAMLLIEALARALGDTEPIGGFSAKKLWNYYLLNVLESLDMTRLRSCAAV